MIDRRWLIAFLVFGAGFWIGRWNERIPEAASADPTFTFPAPANAGEVLRDLAPGETFVSTQGGSAYLWKRTADRIELVGHCQTTEAGAEGQAGFVWLPGVERRR